MLDNITDGTYVLIPHITIGRVLFLTILLVIASWFRRRQRDNGNLWFRAQEPVPRSFEASAAPLVVARRGCVGLLYSWIYGFLWFGTWLLIVAYMLDWISPQVDFSTWIQSSFFDS